MAYIYVPTLVNGKSLKEGGIFYQNYEKTIGSSSRSFRNYESCKEHRALLNRKMPKNNRGEKEGVWLAYYRSV